MASKITRRIASDAGVPELASILAKLPGSDLTSLLLDVFRTRASGLREPAVLAQTEREALLQPSSVGARVLNHFDRIAFAAAEGFEAVDPSPVCALGAERVLGGIHQNNVLTTIRNAEVLGDSTPALALECARRRRRDRSGAVRLCCSSRAIRLQPFDVPGFTPHFRLFAMVSAGRDGGTGTFEYQEIAQHVGFYLGLFRALNEEGFSLTAPLVEVSDMRITEAALAAHGCSHDDVRRHVRAHIPGSGDRFLADRGIELKCDQGLPATVGDLASEFPEAQFRLDPTRLEGLGYYRSLCLRISPTAPDGVRYPVADGGCTDWTARLLQDRKERLMTSGIGSEFVCRKFRVQ